MLDDVFFIHKKCINRATGSQNVDFFVNNACTLPRTYLDQAYSVIHSATRAKLPGARLQTTIQTDLSSLHATSTVFVCPGQAGGRGLKASAPSPITYWRSSSTITRPTTSGSSRQLSTLTLLQDFEAGLMAANFLHFWQTWRAEV